ncbi:MAG: CinA family protein [Thiotrichales bacterium]
MSPTHDDQAIAALAAEVVRALVDQGWMLVAAESCTGGWIAKALTDIPGSSAALDRGYVTYTNAAKAELLGVDPGTLAEHGAVSEAVALEMARGALSHSHAKIAVAVSGIAGPGGGTALKPVGTVCFAWATQTDSSGETAKFAGDRDAVRRQAVRYALEGVLARIRRSAERT